MKISVRLTVSVIVIAVTAILLCCTMLLMATAGNHVNSAVDNGIGELKMLSNSFYAEMNVNKEKRQMSETAKSSLMRYVFRNYASASVSGADYVLLHGEEVLFNDSAIDPSSALVDLKEQSARAYDVDSGLENQVRWPNTIVSFEGRRYLVVGHYDSGVGEAFDFEHELYLVRDITDIYRGIAKLGVWFGVIAFGTILVCGFGMMFQVRRILRPLGDLRRNAAALASGQYDQRIQVVGKDEIAELGSNFNKMAEGVAQHIDALKATAEERKLLLAVLTHELKTPMTAIIGYSEALMKIRLSQEQKEVSIAYIHRECKRMERLSQKMMQLITLHDGEKPKMERCSVSKLYEAIRETIGEIADKEKIQFTLEEEDGVSFDMDLDMMASVLINLFDNARKAKADHIRIKADSTGIAVVDNGVGIPESEVQKITQPFYMVDQSYSKSVGGSGLGLAICELILKAHGARLSIESEEDAGTVVWISF